MHRLYFLLFLGLVFITCQRENQNEGKASNKEVGEWQSIFNGKDLNGWETMGKLATNVKDGVLHIHATDPNNNAWVYTKKDYQNFKLEAEFLMADSATNSGILFRFDPEKEGQPNQIAYEANIDWRINHQNVMGTLEYAARANNIPEVDIMDWQQLRIEANGDYLQVFFNNQLICETHNSRATKGRIALQVPINQGGDIAFRNIRVQELPNSGEPALPLAARYHKSDRPLQPLFNQQSLEDWHTTGPGTWNFEEGVLHGYSGNTSSFLISDKAYRNFYLKCFFKIEKEANSGIFIRKSPDSTNVSLKDAIECNIYDHNGYSHVYSTGSIVTHARAFSNLVVYNEWNEMEIFAENEQVVLTINGKKSAEAHLPKELDKSGNICLQAGTRIFSDNGPSSIYFKDMMIKEMD